MIEHSPKILASEEKVSTTTTTTNHRCTVTGLEEEKTDQRYCVTSHNVQS